jgi:hypothetical protein
MKTFVVLSSREPDWSFIANAETPIEAVQYAIARNRRPPGTYVVYDHDLNPFQVEVGLKTWMEAAA